MITYRGDIFGMIPSPPIGLASLAAYVREKGFEVNILDCFGESPCASREYRKEFIRIGLGEEEIFERIDREAMLIGISIHSGMVASFCLNLALGIKKRFNIPVVVGGPHVSGNYKDFLKGGVDFAVIGEGETPLIVLVQRLSSGGVVTDIPGVVSKERSSKPAPNTPVDMDVLPFPAWDLVPLANYWALKMTHAPVSGRFAPIITSRGCPFNCSFCSTPFISNRKWRGYSPRRIVSELEYLKEQFGIEDVFIQDDNFSINSERVIAFCELLERKNLGIRLSLPSGIRLETISPELVPWAIGINACASVTASILTIIMAMGLGFDATLAIGLATYGIALLCFMLIKNEGTELLA
jgi:radical SAM superfamily enzyme YgiQ (UPF0313 family)